MDNGMQQQFPKRCTNTGKCEAVYASPEAFRALPFDCEQDMYDGVTVAEMRRCGCGSTLGIQCNAATKQPLEQVELFF